MIIALIVALLTLAALVVVLLSRRPHPRHELVFHLIAACMEEDPEAAVFLASREPRPAAFLSPSSVHTKFTCL